jgi:hypothetical protein
VGGGVWVPLMDDSPDYTAASIQARWRCDMRRNSVIVQLLRAKQFQPPIERSYGRSLRPLAKHEELGWHTEGKASVRRRPRGAVGSWAPASASGVDGWPWPGRPALRQQSRLHYCGPSTAADMPEWA